MKHCHLISSTTFSSQSEVEEIIAKTWNLTRVSVSELLINKLKFEAKASLTLEIKKYLESGELIPTELILGLLSAKIAELKDGILISGFPRTKEQLISLELLLKYHDFQIDKIWILEVQNIEEIISNQEYKQSSDQIRDIFKSSLERNKELEKIIDNSEIISKISFDYPVNWASESMLRKIKAVHNNA